MTTRQALDAIREFMEELGSHDGACHFLTPDEAAASGRRPGCEIHLTAFDTRREAARRGLRFLSDRVPKD